ncbi:hypothetical protein [Qipengyuania sediminis]|uniref:hypothetical protein n=1 Tax=Qipengyuania sediminis TaxID=1532023 RepID=UPI0010593BAF|nr:hypothetical protein [Qipengyuania sediminis]
MANSMTHVLRRGLGGGALIAAVLLPTLPLQAQAVVQALPPREAGELNAALRRLATRPADLDALLKAGNAALALRDITAAAGFFTRASAVAPGDPRVLLGQARVALEQRRPVAALDLFTRAERAGTRPGDMAADRALAYDLVGDNAAAQALYRAILASGDSPEVRRRLALSLAIAGNRSEFERTLNPLLKANDRSAFRTRAFGLAVLGSTDDAVEIAEAMMPTDLALRMAPYLRYMPRLTKAQQAAAGNLGAFPAAAEIGRDSADIAGYAAEGARIAARADASLTPAGAALGPRQAEPPRTAPPPQRSGREVVAVAPPPVARNQAPPVTVAVAPPPASQAETPPVTIAATETAPAPPRQSLADAFAEFGAAPVPAAASPTPGAVDVARLAEEARARAARDAKARADRAKAEKARADKAKAELAKVEKAKADKAKAEAATKAAEPARKWLQLGVGRNAAAFAFDWKRLARQAGGALDGKGPWAAKYGASNRMLAGPYQSDTAVKAAIARLKAKDIEALPFESAAGEKVAKVD